MRCIFRPSYRVATRQYSYLQRKPIAPRCLVRYPNTIPALYSSIINIKIVQRWPPATINIAGRLIKMIDSRHCLTFASPTDVALRHSLLHVCKADRQTDCLRACLGTRAPDVIASKHPTPAHVLSVLRSTSSTEIM